jgi:hypothetical protein
MKSLFIVAALSACVLCAQTPNFSGVWKVIPEKSKIAGPPATSYMILVEQADGKLKETVSVVGQRGEQRSNFTYNTDEKPAGNTMGGMSMRTTAAMDGGALVLTSQIASAKPGKMTEKWTLSADGNTLTIERTQSMNGRDMQATLVAEKQPDSAGDALRKPEETAGVHYKNIQVLKDIPSSALIDSMRNFNMSLGVECEHCHVQGNFTADDKPAKAMARKMLVMTKAINAQAFNGRNEVRCYTCHKGQADPANHPAYQ